MFKHILVPVDGSELSDAAVARACVLAGECGARLSFYFARPTYLPTALAGEAPFDAVAAYDAFHAAMAAQAKAIVAQAVQAAEAAGVPHEALVDDCDSPWRGIVAAAEARGCDLIFMASHGRRGAGALLLGSETQKVLTHCKVPVLVWR
jgi:nucleotide-binding universal stress UspA family protein